jgi:hypothetical protein
MHPVIEKISARRGAKTPVKDGEKLILFVLGGLTAGVRSAGALSALKEAGLTHSFDAIYSISAGFANSCYFLAEQVDTGLSIYYEDLNNKNFINKLHPWHLLNVDYIVDIMKRQKPLNIRKLYQAKTKLYAGMRNFKTKKTEYKEVHEHSPKEFFQLFRATTSVPFLSPGKVRIGSGKYKDYTRHSLKLDDHLDLIFREKPTGVLIIYNDFHQVKLPSLFSDKIYEIIPSKDWKLSHTETNSDALRFEADRMKAFVANLFQKQKIPGAVVK